MLMAADHLLIFSASFQFCYDTLVEAHFNAFIGLGIHQSILP
jgi:hypothetical protein